MKKIFLILIVCSFVGAGCAKETPDPIGDSYLEGHDFNAISHEITDWINKRYSTKYHDDKIAIMVMTLHRHDLLT